jgi:predicted CXXCH cytochrome family protein
MFRRLVLTLALVTSVGAALYLFLVPGLSVARREPPQLEVMLATWLLRQSVPDSARNVVSPLGENPDPASVAAGADLFRQKCEVCHGYDGSGRTEMGAGQYPRPPSLRVTTAELSDGEIFYHIRNGIRNTGMPAWDMPDNQVWQLVAHIRDLPEVAPVVTEVPHQTPPIPGASYAGSASCRECHQDVYDRWSKSRMANVVRDPRERPDAIIPNLSMPHPLLTFSVNDIALVYGSRWKQRYFTKIGNDYFPFPAQWDVMNEMWRPYMVADGTDWWTEFYPRDNFQRPTGPLCDGCHSVNYNVETKAVTEWNVGCERCHGAGSVHVEQKTRDSILNPARMHYVQANDTCIQCHSQGQPKTNPIAGQYYDWPVGYHVGLNLADFWKLEEHELGDETFTHFPNGIGHKNRMQGNDYVQSLMYERGVTCFSCHDPHGGENESILRRPINEVCLSCHSPNSQAGPRAVSIEAHTHHKADSTGSQCAACHMPRIEQTIADINVSSHTFHFVSPAQTDATRIPNACNVCHTDKDTAWATAALKTWTDRSPWRVAH